MMCDNDYLFEALNCVENLRINGLENAKYTDIYTEEDLIELDKWYGTIEKYLIDNELTNYVKEIVVYENRQGEILRVQHIEYSSVEEYFENDRNLEIIINLS